MVIFPSKKTFFQLIYAREELKQYTAVDGEGKVLYAVIPRICGTDFHGFSMNQGQELRRRWIVILWLLLLLQPV